MRTAANFETWTSKWDSKRVDQSLDAASLPAISADRSLSGVLNPNRMDSWVH